MLQSIFRMDLPLFDAPGTPARPLSRAGAKPLLALLLAGLFLEVVNHEEASAGIDYGLSLLALLGASGCLVSMAGLRWANLDPSPWAGIFPTGPGLTDPAPGLPTKGTAWPLLVSLLFGTVVVLISGLGNWV